LPGSNGRLRYRSHFNRLIRPALAKISTSSLGWRLVRYPHAWHQKDIPKPIGCADANRPADRLSSSARGRLGENVGALDRFGPSNEPFARVSQSVAGAVLAKETAVRRVFKRLECGCATVVRSVPSCSDAAESVPVRATPGSIEGRPNSDLASCCPPPAAAH
jgi:hypothetical protein